MQRSPGAEEGIQGNEGPHSASEMRQQPPPPDSPGQTAYPDGEDRVEEEDEEEAGSPHDAAFQRSLRPGQRVDVRDTMGSWLPAVIYEADPDRVFVHYIGWVHRWNEWVHRASPRLAPRGRHCCTCAAGRGQEAGSTAHG